VFELDQSGAGLGPAEDLLDAFSASQTNLIAGVVPCAVVDGAFAPRAGFIDPCNSQICYLQLPPERGVLPRVTAHEQDGWRRIVPPLAILFLVIYPPLIWVVARLPKPVILVFFVLGVIVAMVADGVMQFWDNSVSAFKGARANSTRVRAALGEMAKQRWYEEAPVFGHGAVQRGTHDVEFKPIGSPHSWYGRLYVKGLAGVVSLVVPALWCFFEMLLLAQVSQLGRLGLASIFIMLYYNNGENFQILAYLFWPALLILGAAHAEAAGRNASAWFAAEGAV